LYPPTAGLRFYAQPEGVADISLLHFSQVNIRGVEHHTYFGPELRRLLSGILSAESAVEHASPRRLFIAWTATASGPGRKQRACEARDSELQFWVVGKQWLILSCKTAGESRYIPADIPRDRWFSAALGLGRNTSGARSGNGCQVALSARRRRERRSQRHRHMKKIIAKRGISEVQLAFRNRLWRLLAQNFMPQDAISGAVSASAHVLIPA